MSGMTPPRAGVAWFGGRRPVRTPFKTDRWKTAAAPPFGSQVRQTRSNYGRIEHLIHYVGWKVSTVFRPASVAQAIGRECRPHTRMRARADTCIQTHACRRMARIGCCMFGMRGFFHRSLCVRRAALRAPDGRAFVTASQSRWDEWIAPDSGRLMACTASGNEAVEAEPVTGARQEETETAGAKDAAAVLLAATVPPHHSDLFASGGLPISQSTDADGAAAGAINGVAAQLLSGSQFRCERSTSCVRGFRHLGRGGKCSANMSNCVR